MADQVAISTFLELRDNLTPKLLRVSAELQKIAKLHTQLTTNFTKVATAANSAQKHISTLSNRLPLATKRAQELSAALAKTTGKQAEASAAPGGLLSSMSKLTGTFAAAELLVDGLKAGFGAAKDAVVGMFKTAIHYGIEYEKVNTDIASALFTTKMGPSMAVGKAAADDLMKTMHDMSLKLPGQAQDYYYVFSQGLPAAISVGMQDMQQFAKFVSEYTAVAIKRNVSSQRAATDLQMMLQGRARITTNMFQKLLPYLNMTTTEFNKLMKTDRAKGIELLVNAVRQAASGMKGVSADALTTFGELKTRMQDIAIWGEKPLFQAAKNSVIDINHWLAQNTNAVNNLANTVSTVLGDALQGVVGYIIEAADGLRDMLGLANTRPADRTLSTVAKELDKARLEFHSSTLPSPVLRGRISRLEKEYEELLKHEAQLEKTRQYFSFLGPSVPSVSISSPGALGKLAQKLTELYQHNVFDVPGQKQSEALADYLESRGVTKLSIQKIWTEMIKKGAETPLSLAHPDSLESELSEPPAERTKHTTNFYNNRFDIKQEFAEGFDPDRIAIAFSNDLGRLGEMKLQAAYGHLGMVR